MQVYEYSEDSNVYTVPFDWDDDVNIDYVRNIVEEYFDKNQPVGNHWQPPFFGVVEKTMKTGDLGILSGSEMIVFSQRAVDTLSPLIQRNVEFLPYPTEVGTYYLINVLDEGNYLDRKLSDYDEMLPNGLCFGINKYVFDAEKLQHKHIFRIPDDPVTRFVSGEFIATCKKHKLRGIYLDDSVKVWNSTTS